MLDEELMPKERVYLWRRRRNLSQPEAARAVGLGRGTMAARRWWEWENGVGPAPPHRVQFHGSPKEWEMMELWRRRLGWSLLVAGAAMGVSHVTLGHWERGEWDWMKGWDWWERRRTTLGV